MSDGVCQNVVILGATGSIGDSTIDLIKRHPQLFSVFAITGHSNIKKLIELCVQLKPQYVLISDQALYTQLHQEIQQQKLTVKILSGSSDMLNLCQMPEVDMVVAGIVGSAGMEPVLATVKAGKKLLLANKEALVLAGDLVMQAAKQNQAQIIPLDSEHNAIFQCLPDDYVIGRTPDTVEKIILTASGGPFWDRCQKTFKAITVEQACAHPNWDMGRKISVDSATLMNKGLEIIEAHWLFQLDVNKIDVHVHPQSIIHSMVCYKDCSVLAQLGEPDMRIPIAYGLGLRERISSGASMLDLLKVHQLQFFPPDYEKFPCLGLAQNAINLGGTAMAVLNAANEISVDAFLNKRIRFTDIATVNSEILESSTIEPVTGIQQLIEVDKATRANAQQFIQQRLT